MIKQNGKWRAFASFIRDYSQQANNEALDTPIWNHYYVYSISLDEVKQMNNIGKYESNTNSLNMTHFDNFQYDTWLKQFEQSIVKAEIAASSSDDFSSGGGGGGGGRGAF